MKNLLRPDSSVWIEQKFPKLLVGGSSPLRGTKIFKGNYEKNNS
jgi:hypothetical protein